MNQKNSTAIDDGIKIILIEQEQLRSDDIKKIINDSFSTIEIESAGGADTNVDVIRGKQPDIILVDYRNSFTCDCDKINPLPEIAPVIVISSEDFIDRIIEMMCNGVRDYIPENRLQKLIPVIERIINDISRDRKLLQTINKLKQSRDRYLNLINNLNVVIFRTTADGRFIRVNHYFEELTGYKIDELSNLPVQNFYEDPEQRKELINELHMTGIVRNKVIVFKRKDGARITADVKAAIFKSKDGSDIYIDGIIENITDRVETEHRLYRINYEYELLFNSISNVIIGVSRNDVITHWNNVAEKIFGIPQSEIIGKSFIECNFQWDWNDIYVGIADTIIDGKPITLSEINFIMADGKKGIISVTINPLRNTPDDPIQGFLILGEDHTEQHKLEQQLMRVSNLEAIGQLSAGISHEINSPMQYICDNIDFIENKFSLIKELNEKSNALLEKSSLIETLKPLADEIISFNNRNSINKLINEIPEALNDAVDGTERIKKIITAMKRFSHPGGDKKELTNINQIIGNLIIISRNEWKYVADCIQELDENLPVIPCIESELNQVLLNLIVNARDAISEAISKKTISKGIIKISTALAAEGVEIRISDNGCGIPESIRTKIFNPFFTTKGVGKGTGQGLAISQTIIVNNLNGSISFESAVNQGTEFIIILPVK